jgi:asparaginyl-tRNA synthetase
MQYSLKRVLNGEAPADQTITVQGWVRTRRDSKAGISFIQLHDGSCFATCQLVVPNSLPNYEQDVLKLTTGCSLRASGRVVASPGQGQKFEMQAESIEVLGWVDNPETYPMQPKRHTMEFLRDVAHLRPRTNTLGAVMRIRHLVSMTIHQFFHSQGFYWVHTPLITASDCEGAGEMFRVSTLDLLNIPKTAEGKVDFSQDFFGKESFLTVSGQLNLECYCCALSKVYSFGPTFRAENSNTSRHLAEFWMVEPEIAFANLADNALLAEQLLKAISQAVLEHGADEMAFFQEHSDPECIKRLEGLVKDDFARMEYTEAVDILQKSNKKFEFPVQWGHDLQSEHERYIAEEHVGRPVILMNYPKEIKGFYMRLNEDHKTVAAMDVLAPGIGEIIGGSQREERLDVLDARLTECRLEPEAYQWYRDLRRYGTVPHAGFGLGLERMISYITGVANVRDVIPFPRTPGNISY